MFKWPFSGSANDLWGEEVQGYGVNGPQHPLGGNVDIFRPEKVNQIRVRFFNLSRGDDASNDFRCAFLKFGDSENEGPFDLAFTTGKISCYASHTWSLREFLNALDGDEDDVMDWAFRKPAKCILRPDIELPSDTYLQQKLRKIAIENKTMKLQVQIRDGSTEGESVYDPMTAWEESEYPWQDVADLLLTYSVPKIDTERAKFNFTKAPDGIQICVPAGKENYGGLIPIQEKVLTSTSRKKHPEAEAPSDGKETTFLVHVETGNHMFSGTDAGVYIALFGTKGRTKKILLDKLFHNDFERGSKESYYITVPVIGDVKFVQVFLIGGTYTFARDWFLSNIVLFDLTTRKLFDLPVYRWISDKLVLPTGNAKLPQDESDLDRRCLRQIWLDERREMYPWRHVDGLPGCIDCSSYNELPMDMKYSDERQKEKDKVLTRVLLKLKLHKYQTVFHSFDSFEDFKAMCWVVPQSETMKAIMEGDKWKSDEEFGREFLAGVNPVMIQRLKEPIPKFPVTNEMVGNLLDRGSTLDDEIKAGHVYYADYHHMTGIPRKGEFVVTDSLVMLYVRASGQLVPIAIQLGQTPGAENPIWTPNDSDLDWLLAKSFVKASDAHYQIIYSHLGQTHFLMETITLAMHRQLPPNHPIFRLLVQHCRYTVAAGQSGRDLLIEGNDALFGKILALPGCEKDFLKSRFNDFTVNDLIMPKNFSDRGVDDVNLLPNYPFRDDTLLIWDKLTEYVTKMLSYFYATDKDVVEDTDLKGFLADLHDNGLAKSNGQPHGLPSKLSTICEMVEFTTMIIFQSSCYHSAMNFPQLDYFCFGPNYPVSMRKAPPSEKGKTTLQDIIDTLPNKATQSISIAVACYLSAPRADEIYFGDYAESQFTESNVREVQEWFSKELEKVSNTIQTRNLDRDVPYVYLIPEHVPKAAGQ